MIIRYCVQTYETIQVAEDSWKVRTRTLEVDDNTALIHIRLWYEKIHGEKNNSPIELKITQLETI